MSATFGPYELLERLGAGGMAETFVAVRRGPGRFEQRVCVKRILPSFENDPHFVAQFLEEARVSARLRHNNVIQVTDFGVVEGSHYLALELVEGMDLAKLLTRLREREQSLGAGLVAHLAIELATGLEYAHGHPSGAVLHRDVSPSNVLLSVAGEVKLGDFGIAKAHAATGTTDPGAPKTQTGTLKGKIPYMPAEYALQGVFEPRSDLFALGVLLYEALAGRRPFVGATDFDTLHKIASGEHAPLRSIRPDVPASLAAAIERQLSPRPELRAESAALFLDALVESPPPPNARRILGDLVRTLGRTPAPGEGRVHEGTIALTDAFTHPSPSQPELAAPGAPTRTRTPSEAPPATIASDPIGVGRTELAVGARESAVGTLPGHTPAPWPEPQPPTARLPLIAHAPSPRREDETPGVVAVPSSSVIQRLPPRSGWIAIGVGGSLGLVAALLAAVGIVASASDAPPELSVAAAEGARVGSGVSGSSAAGASGVQLAGAGPVTAAIGSGARNGAGGAGATGAGASGTGAGPSGTGTGAAASGAGTGAGASGTGAGPSGTGAAASGAGTGASGTGAGASGTEARASGGSGATGGAGGGTASSGSGAASSGAGGTASGGTGASSGAGGGSPGGGTASSSGTGSGGRAAVGTSGTVAAASGAMGSRGAGGTGASAGAGAQASGAGASTGTGASQGRAGPAGAAGSGVGDATGSGSSGGAAEPRGRVRVTVSPWGNVWIDGRFMGRAPLLVPLAEGSHRIQAGFEAPMLERTVRVHASRTSSIELELTP